MDFSTVVNIVGIAGLVLAIPLSIASNILTPKFQDWWATTSAARANRRQQHIVTELRYRLYLELKPNAWRHRIIRLAVVMSLCIVFMLSLLMSLVLEGLYALHGISQHTFTGFNGFTQGVLAALTASIYYNAYVFYGYSREVLFLCRLSHIDRMPNVAELESEVIGTVKGLIAEEHNSAS
ncbi:hypothetical protein [Paludibaculum fermentans]|uniref:hypothetical protein n=1 Tax=Paludibaculum fermentans TaxID=1473598 RepID=UPI003EBEC1B7